MWIVTVVIFGALGKSVRTYGPYANGELAEAARRRLHMRHIMPLFNASQRASFAVVSELQGEKE